MLTLTIDGSRHIIVDKQTAYILTEVEVGQLQVGIGVFTKLGDSTPVALAKCLKHIWLDNLDNQTSIHKIPDLPRDILDTLIMLADETEWPWCESCKSYHHPKNVTCKLKGFAAHELN